MIRTGLISLAILGMSLPGQALGETRIGTAAAANQVIEGTPPNAQTRTIRIGSNVVQDEEVRTSPIGSGQILFADQTTLTIAPDSILRLDRFVYDPEAQDGEMALTLGRGVMRFIGGRISKKKEVGIRTPTATIGIRGGLATVETLEDGTVACLLAGEWAKIRGTRGDTLTLSRTGVCGEVKDGEARFAGTVSRERLARYYSLFEGGGDGGRNAPVTDAPITRISVGNSGIPGGEQGGELSTIGEERPEDAIPDNGFIERENETGTGGQEVVEDDGENNTPVPQGGGANVVLADTNATPFVSLTFGSIIGENADGDLVEIPVPGSGGNESALNPNGGDVTAVALAGPGAGLFTFPEEVGGFGTTSRFGAISGAGFTDPNAGFTFYEFQVPGGADEGFGFFGEPSGFQSQFADTGQPYSFTAGALAGQTLPAGDFSGIPAGAATADIVAGTDLNGGTNVVEGYRIQPNLVLGGDTSLLPGEVFIVGDQNLPRFDIDGVTAPEGDARWLAAELTIDTDGATQEVGLSVMVDRIRSTGAGGPVLDAELYSSVMGGTDAASGNLPVGTLEDNQGNTVFGPNGEYLVLSSWTRDGNLSPAGGQVVSQGSATGFDHDAATGTTTLDMQALDTFGVFAAKDAALSETLSDPLPLASLAGTDAAYTGGFAAGMAHCDDGCGFLTGTGADLDRYAVRSRSADGASFGFETAGNGVTGTINVANQPVVGSDSGANFDAVLGGNPIGPTLLSFEFADNEQGAAIDDMRFAGQATGGVSTVSATVGGEGAFQASDVGSFDGAYASAGLVGDGGFLPPGVDAPKYLSWGYWSATYTQGEGTPDERTDLIPLGTFVAGVRPVQGVDTLPNTQVSFAGGAIGTHYDIPAGTTEIVGGSFELLYDFGQNRGILGLEVPDAGIDAAVLVTGGDFAEYSGTAGICGAGCTSVDGGFFKGDLGPASATGGSFEHVAPGNDAVTVGTYGGDVVVPE